MRVLSTEVLESLTSLTIDYRRLRVDSAGPGEYRGGFGQVYRLRNTSGQPLVVIGLGRRNEFPALGLRGGQPGAKRMYKLNGEVVHPRGRYVLGNDETIEVFDAGGGGFGDPKNRDRKAVKADIEAGLITAEAAREAYGLTGV
jgi:N-methylhydantoinase B